MIHVKYSYIQEVVIHVKYVQEFVIHVKCRRL